MEKQAMGPADEAAPSGLGMDGEPMTQGVALGCLGAPLCGLGMAKAFLERKLPGSLAGELG